VSLEYSNLYFGHSELRGLPPAAINPWSTARSAPFWTDANSALVVAPLPVRVWEQPHRHVSLGIRVGQE
jgi:hypothetical protein